VVWAPGAATGSPGYRRGPPRAEVLGFVEERQNGPEYCLPVGRSRSSGPD
jgi:hypothetical protein